ncbi:unnamed protein product [Nezara viridula]|uniref:HMG box-containing protein 4 n=1 Tax=Nezara viridula TaxID=85310 RepID=A0A9P0H5A5_NEZVI|nr:unnamed protein product [Nezara viridula]
MMDDSFEYGSKKIKTEGELEVTGVSRSGRVRKKSSKLTDFESLDEIDMRSPKAKKEKQDYSIPLARSIKKEKIIKEEILTDEEEMDSGNFVLNKEAFIKQEVYSDESEPDLVYPTNDESSMDSLGSDMDDIEEPDIDREDTEGFQPIVGDSVDDSPTQSTSVYAMERSNKKKLVIKDGKIVGRVKAQRKDKGIWKRRAKRLAARGMAKQQQQQHQQTVAIPETKKMKSPPSRKFINKQSVSPATSNNIVLSPETKSNKGSTALDSGVFKPVGTTPLDVAAHLRLLGESLTIIGERLTEHEGQIAVSGSFSVLLDSLLCALGPLLCLTQQVPQLNVIPQEQLSQLMDNIAYIMPGL